MSYLKENQKIMRQLKHTSFTKFWKNYISSDTNKVPYHGLFLTKMPCDFFIYPDIFYRYKPDTIVEIGTCQGSSAIWFSDISHAKVITIDINCPEQNVLDVYRDKDIVFIHGDATTSGVYKQVEELVKGDVFVVDDGSHKTKDVYDSFKLFHGLISKGGFYIVEDGMSALLFKDRPLTLPNDAVDRILGEYDFELFTEYDRFVFGAMFRGILRRKEG